MTFLALAAEPILAQDTAFSYQGQLTQGGAPVDGVVQMRFTVWDADADGTQVSGEVVLPAVNVNAGLFTALLDFGLDAFDGQPRWLQISVGDTGGPTSPLQPRQLITAAPYSIRAASAGDAEHADSAIACDSVPWAGVANVPAGFADGTDDVGPAYTAGAGLSLNGSQFSVNFAGTGSANTAARSDHNHLSGGGDNLGSHSATQNIALNGNWLSGDGGNEGIRVDGNGNVGIGTTNPDDKLEIESSDQLFVHLDGATGSQIRLDRGSATNSASVLYETAGTRNWEAGTRFNVDPAIRTDYNIYNNSRSAVDLRIENTTGRVLVTGTLSKGAGSFRIDHPLDPENKYLLHSFVESPDMLNVYNGVLLLDDHGVGRVTLPDWFGALNRDFRYLLTPIGGPGPNLHISQEIEANQFEIAGGSPGLKVSWQVTGIRQDPYANAHRIPVEEEKSSYERGRFLHPELYGRPRERSVYWAPPESDAQAATGESPVPLGDSNAMGVEPANP